MPKADRKVIAAARVIVEDRDGGRCQMCGISLTALRSVHHRAPKGMGGSARLEQPSNLVSLCGSGTTGCHSKAHSNPHWAKNHGWIVSRFHNPEDIPVDTFEGWFLLANDGSRVPYDGAVAG